jgi:hypothetical protein
MPLERNCQADAPGPELFAAPHIVVEPAGDGCLLLRSAEPLSEHPRTVIHSLRAWADRDPDHPLIAERAAGGSWRTRGYGDRPQVSDGHRTLLPG